jgi:O-antigen/teichoic acid export membrane protein
VLASSDKLALNWFTTTYALGIFSMAQRVSGLLTFVIGPVQMAWGPYALSISNNADAKERYAETMGLMVPFTLMSVLGLAALAKPIIVVFATREFLAADPLVGLLALAAALNTLYSFAGVGLVLTGKTHLISVGFMLAAGLTLVLNILLCPVLGMHGVAIASCVGHGTALGAVSVMSQRAYPIPYRRRSLVVSAMLFVPTLAAITMLDGEGVWASTCARLGVVAVFAIGLFATGAVNSAKITSSLGIFAKGKV